MLFRKEQGDVGCLDGNQWDNTAFLENVKSRNLMWTWPVLYINLIFISVFIWISGFKLINTLYLLCVKTIIFDVFDKRAEARELNTKLTMTVKVK